MPASVGAVTTIVPVAIVQLGCTVTDAVGADGAVLTVTLTAVDVAEQLLLLTTTVYAPAVVAV